MAKLSRNLVTGVALVCGCSEKFHISSD